MRGKNKLWNEVMPSLMEKYGFTMQTPIMKTMNEIIKDPEDLRKFKLAFKYPNGLPHWKNN